MEAPLFIELQRCEPIQKNTEEACVGLGASILRDGKSKHVGIYVRYAGSCMLLHFYQNKVSLSPVPTGDLWIYKRLDFIKPEMVPPFLAHCITVKDNSNPQFGYFFSDTYYDRNGKFFSNSGIKEYMTCVGFCINVIKGFLEDHEYFAVADWSSAETLAQPDEYFEQFVGKQIQAQNITMDDVELFRPNLRRIKPAEFISSGFVKDLPIRRFAVAAYLEQVETEMMAQSVAFYKTLPIEGSL